MFQDMVVVITEFCL